MRLNCHIRVACAGNEAEMTHLCAVLLENCDVETQPDDRPPMKLEEMYSKIHSFSQEEEGGECEFLYGMLAPRTFGDAERDSCRFRILRHKCGLFTALFTYDSQCNFQAEDFLAFHKQCGCMPMIAIHACDDFGAEKGTTVFTGGRSFEDWNNLQLVWFWLICRYETGFPPEEAVMRLQSVEKILEENDSDITIAELIESALKNIEYITADEEISMEEMQLLRDKKDFEGIMAVYMNLLERELWECEHAALWTANLGCLMESWEKYKK